MRFVMIYMTAADQAEADRIADALISQRLAACVNILGEISSVYHWQGGVERDTEVALIAKTREDLVEAVTKCVTEVHSYTCPCIVSLPLDGGNPGFLDWIAAETAEAETGGL